MQIDANDAADELFEEKTLTSTSFQGKKTVTVTLKKGSWKYYCSIHEPQMFGFFKVTS